MPVVYDDQDQREDQGTHPDVFDNPDLKDLDKSLDDNYDNIVDEENALKRYDDELDGDNSDSTPDTEKLASAEDDEADEDEEEDDPEDQALAPVVPGGEQDFFNPSARNASGGGFIKKQGTKMLVVAGVSGLVLTFGSIFGFLNTFRLKHLMENVNFHAFNRYNAAVERRSDKWVQAYTKVRMLEFGNGENQRNADGNLYFRANKVDTNNPFRDWYQTMRTSNFEDDLLKNQGIRFTSSIDSEGKIRPAKITIKGNENSIVPNARGEFSVLGDVNGPQLDALTKDLDSGLINIFDDDTGGNKAARLAIRDAVNKETHKWQVIKRRKHRQAIANMTGVRDWRFFDKTRTKIENKKAEFKKKMIKKVFGKESRSSNFLLCVLGLGGCSATTDASNPDNRSARGSASSVTQAEGDSPGVDESGNPLPGDATDGTVTHSADTAARDAANELADLAEREGTELTEKKFNSELMEKITKQFTDAVGGGGPIGVVKKILDWTLKFENNLGKNETTGRSKIGDAIYMARLTGSLMVAYATISTITDQMQSGEVDPDQVNAAMEYFDGASNSEAFSFIFNGEEFPSGLKQERKNADGSIEKVDKCANGEAFTQDDLVPFCEQFKPNGGSKISGLENAWNKFITDSPIGTVLSGYKAFKDSFVGSIFSKVGDFFGDVVGKVLTPILDGLGITDAIGAAASWLSERLMSWVGVKPCMTGAESSGAMAVNCLVGGASGAAETATREAGGVLVKFTDPAYLYSEKLAIDYNRDTYNSMGTYDKYFAVNNHMSLASNLLFGMSLNNNPLTTVGSLFSPGKNFGKAFSGLGSILSGKALAASEDEGFKNTAKFSGVDAYAIPQNCVEGDPLDPNYLQNASNNPNITHDVTTLGNGAAYSAALYKENGDSLDENEIKGIYDSYNCVAFDNVVRGGLGYAYGYSGDDGYSSSGGEGATGVAGVGNFVAGTDPTNIMAPAEGSDGCPPSPTIAEGYRTEAQRGDTKLTIKLCKVHGYLINLAMAKNFDDLYNEMDKAGFMPVSTNDKGEIVHDQGDGGNFRTYAQQAAMHERAPNSTAPPGRSNHELGLAVDTSCANKDRTDIYRPWAPNESRGLPDFQNAIKHGCLNWIHTNSSKYGLLLQCDGKGANGGEISAKTGGCETWHLSPTGK